MIKRIFFTSIFILNFIHFEAYCQPIKKTDIYRLAAFGKVWGFLKYFHPEVAKGKFEWDTVLTNNYDRILAITNKNDFNKLLERVIDQAGPIPFCPNCPRTFPDSLKINLDLGWINDSASFLPSVIQRLTYIYKAFSPINNFYIKRQKNIGNPIFPNERRYNDVILPDHSYRFLALCRFWNVINYYYPYRYLLHDWDSLYINFIPRLFNMRSDYFYFRAMQEMATYLNDGHGFIEGRNIDYFSNRRVIPIRIKRIDSLYYVVRCIDSVICQRAGVSVGDRILLIDNNEPEILSMHYARFHPASNEAYKNYRVDLWLSLVKKDSVPLKLLRNRDTLEVMVPCIENQKKYLRNPDKTPWKLLNDSVGYIHMGFLTEKDIDAAFETLINTRYLIIDSRNYPNWTIYPLADKLLEKKISFAAITEPDYDYPGLIKWVKPMVAGKRNPNHYKGTLIFLVNSNTMSQAEITVMALRNAPRTVVIGTETAGAFGDVSKLPLPGGIDVFFSGLGYYYPDGKRIQQIGILPDIKVETTLSGALSGKDEIMEKAMEYIVNVGSRKLEVSK